jgi:hypothetical protein
MKQKSFYHFYLFSVMTLIAFIYSGCAEDVVENIQETDNFVVFSVNEENGFVESSPFNCSTRTVQEGQLKSSDGNTLLLTVTEEDYIKPLSQTTTRGTQMKASSMTSFGVSASVYPASNSYTSAKCGSYWFNNEITRASGRSGYYWPSSDYRLSFFAHYPYGHSALTVRSADDFGSPVYQYTVPSAVASQADVMTAKVTDRRGGANSSISLPFNHNCAAVKIIFHNEGQFRASTVRSISIEGVKYSGTLHDNIWTLSNSVNSSSINPFSLTCNTTIAAGASVNLTGTSNIFMMLPQSLPATAKLKIVTNNNTYEARLSGTWTAGKIYTYTVGMAEDDYLRFKALESGTFTLTIPAEVTTAYLTSISYSLNGGVTWTTTANSSEAVTITTPTVAAGNSVLWKGNGSATAASTSAYSKFSSTGRFEANGNIMSLLHGDGFVTAKTLSDSYNFALLFSNCVTLTSVSSGLLPATTLSPHCYHDMFSGCTSLSVVPSNFLPATTLTESCYAGMFQHCPITTTPALPSTSLAIGCYDWMFRYCSSLTSTSTLPATTLATRCYRYMFANCTNLTTSSALPATTMPQSCYEGMFYGCTSLTSAPALPATICAVNCCKNMFYGCTSLSTAPTILPSKTLANSCYEGMFRGCTSLTSAPALQATTLAQYCCKDMFNGCTSLITPPSSINAITIPYQGCAYMFMGCINLRTAPAISATTLEYGSCMDMFNGCTSLTEGPELSFTTFNGIACCVRMFQGCTNMSKATSILPATTLTSQCYRLMFNNCPSLVRAPILPARTLVGSCYQQMFLDCVSLNYVKMMATDISASQCVASMLYNVSSSGILVKNSAATWSGVVPAGWTIQTATE